jgi:hypothetical protein
LWQRFPGFKQLPADRRRSCRVLPNGFRSCRLKRPAEEKTLAGDWACLRQDQKGGLFLKNAKVKKPPYEKPLLEPLLVVAQGVTPVCSNGSFVFEGACNPAGGAASGCETGTLPLS